MGRLAYPDSCLNSAIGRITLYYFSCLIPVARILLLTDEVVGKKDVSHLA